mgnify:CR=1 FL=1
MVVERAKKGMVALLFGREDRGLENEALDFETSDCRARVDRQRLVVSELNRSPSSLHRLWPELPVRRLADVVGARPGRVDLDVDARLGCRFCDGRLGRV